MLHELKIKINSLGLKVKCNLSGMLRGIKGKEGIYISEHCPIPGRQKPKQRKEGRHWEVGCHPKLELSHPSRLSVQLIPFGGQLFPLCTHKHFTTMFIWIHWNWRLSTSSQVLRVKDSVQSWTGSIHFIIENRNRWNALRKDTFWDMNQSIWILFLNWKQVTRF